MDLIEVNKDNRKAQRTAPGVDYVPLHSLTRCWEVARHHVIIEKVIGKGAFGQVAKGTAEGLRDVPGEKKSRSCLSLHSLTTDSNILY